MKLLNSLALGSFVFFFIQTPDSFSQEYGQLIEKEFTPQSVEFSEHSLKSQGHINFFKVNGMSSSLLKFKAVSKMPENQKAIVESELKRIGKEIQTILDQLAIERKSAVFINTKIPESKVCSEGKRLGREADLFIDQFKSSEAYAANSRIRKSHFSTGPKLSEKELQDELAKLDNASATAAEKNYDLNGFFNCIDDEDVCFETLRAKHVGDVCASEEWASFLKNLKGYKGSDFVKAGEVVKSQSTRPEVYDGELLKDRHHPDPVKKKSPAAVKK